MLSNVSTCQIDAQIVTMKKRYDEIAVNFEDL